MERVEIFVFYDNFLLYSVNNVQFPFNRPYSNVAYIRERIFCAWSDDFVKKWDEFQIKIGIDGGRVYCVVDCIYRLIWISSKIFANFF